MTGDDAPRLRGEPERRDPELGRELRERIGAPPLARDFLDALWARIEAENAVAAASVPREKAGRRTLSFRRRWLVAAVVVAAATVLGFVLLPVLRGADTATAADVLAAMDAAGHHTVRLRIARTAAVPASSEGDPGDITYDRSTQVLTLATSGSWRSTTSASGRITDRGYDAAALELRSLRRGGPQFAPVCRVEKPVSATGFVLGTYDTQTTSTPGFEFSEYVASVRDALATADPEVPVEEITQIGRKAWRVAFPFKMSGGDTTWETVGTVTVIVDQATGVPLLARFDTRPEGYYSVEATVTELEEDPLLEPGWQRVPFPDGARVTVVDDGQRFGKPAEVAERSWPTLPLVPSWIPAGYRLTLASTNGMRPTFLNYPRSEHPGTTVTRAGATTYKRIVWPSPTARVELVYANGYRRFVVEVYPKLRFGPMSDVPSSLAEVRVMRLSAGFLEGRTARVSVAPFLGSGPELESETDRSSVVIFGDLTRDELVRIAESLEAVGDVNKRLQPL